MFRRVCYIFLLLQVLVSACKEVVDIPEDNPESGPVTLTVATCNVLKPSGRCAEMSLDQQAVRQALGRSIVNTGADIIGFNELDQNYLVGGIYSLSSSCKFTDMTWKIEWPNDIHESGPLTYSYANGFAYNNTKITLEESGYVWLSKGEDTWYVKPASAYLNSGSPERTCIWARMKHKASNKEFWLFVTHLPTDSQGGAYNMARVLNRYAAHKAGDAPAILTGDMNNALGKAPYRALISYWQDGNVSSSWGTLSGSSANYHYTVDVFTRNHPERRIDHIMTRGCTASDYRTIVETFTVDGQEWCPSDHLPVVAKVVIE